MVKRKAKRVFRQTTPQERKRIAKLRAKLDKELPEIKQRARQIRAAYKVAADAISVLRSERERQGLSLADIRTKSGMTREVLCALENKAEPNPTIRTLARYADALGMGIEIRFVRATTDKSGVQRMIVLE